MRLTASPPTPPLSLQNSSILASLFSGKPHHHRQETHPHRLSSRRKPRRCPLVLRFIKGAIHVAIILPVILHALFSAFVVCLDKYVFDTVGLPNSIIPSLSIVVGLMLVFLNQTCYNRFWDGRNRLNTIISCTRNLIRSILIHSHFSSSPLSQAEKEDIERVIRILIAFPFAVKNHLRGEWGVFRRDSSFDSPSLSPSAHGYGSILADSGIGDMALYNAEYADLLPAGFEGREFDGLGLPYQLTFFVDSFVKRGLQRGWFEPPVASMLQGLLNKALDAFGDMETIMLTPPPVAHLIHQKQVLALYGCVLPFAIVDDMGWWTVPIVSLVIFTFYGIEGIGAQLEDPFGYDRNDIKMDAVVGDARVEFEVVLDEWREVGAGVGDGEDYGEDGLMRMMPELFLRRRRMTEGER